MVVDESEPPVLSYAACNRGKRSPFTFLWISLLLGIGGILLQHLAWSPLHLGSHHRPIISYAFVTTLEITAAILAGLGFRQGCNAGRWYAVAYTFALAWSVLSAALFGIGALALWCMAKGL